MTAGRLAERLILTGLGGVILLRLFIGRIFTDTNVLLREDGGNLVTAVAVYALGLGFLLLKTLRRATIQRSGLETPLCCLFAAASLSVLNTVDFAVTLKGVLVLGAYLFFFVMLQDLLSSRRRLRSFLYYFLFLAALTALAGIWEYFLGFGRPPPTGIFIDRESLYYLLTHHRASSFLGWPNVLAGYLLLSLPVSVSLCWGERRSYVFFLWGALGVLLLGCLFVTFSLMGWLSLLLGSGVTAYVVLREQPRAPARPGRGFLLAFAAVLTGLFILVAVQKNLASSFLSRSYYYQNAWTLVLEHPLTGVGYAALRYAVSPLVHAQGAFSAYVHNTYLQAWVETGLPGLLALLWLVMLFSVRSLRIFLSAPSGPDRVLFAGICTGLAAFFIDNFFSFTLIKPSVSLFGWSMLALWAGQARLAAPVTETAGGSSRGFPFTARLALMAAVLAAFVLTLRLTGASFALREAYIALGEKDFTKGIAILQKAEVMDRWDTKYPLALGGAFLKLYRLSASEDLVDRAENEFLEAVRRSPGVYDSHFFLSKIYEHKGDYGKAQAYARQAFRLSPFRYRRDSLLVRDIRRPVQPVPLR